MTTPGSPFTSRRLKLIPAVIATLALAVGSGAGGQAATASKIAVGGADMSGWTVVVGDGVWAPSGSAPVGDADIDTHHHGTHSELVANVEGRGVMAHNITYTSLPDLDRLKTKHTASVDFRLPVLPSTTGQAGETIEVGLFVWDGAATRMDHGFAVQWVINPWAPEFGHIRMWAEGPDGPEWQSVGALTPDTEWHTVSVAYIPTTGRASLAIDGERFDVSEVLTPKAASWGDTIDARFQVETISLWPGGADSAPVQQAEFRNWTWEVARR